MTLKNLQQGFTLIEAIIYVALFSFIMVGGVLAVYQIMAGQTQVSSRGSVEDEGGFVIRKIEWALNDVTNVWSPTASFPYSTVLDVVSNGSIEYVIRRNSATGAVEMSEAGDLTYDPLTTSNVQVSSLHFHYIAASGNSPAGIEASTTINGEEFDTVRYLH